MKSLFIIVLLFCAFVISSFSTQTSASNVVRKQRALATFDQPVHVHGVALKAGEYLIVHDDAAMQRGEACTYIYKGRVETTSRLMVAFHCTHIERTKAQHFILRTTEKVQGFVELHEFQFNGDTESHLVPTK